MLKNALIKWCVFTKYYLNLKKLQILFSELNSVEHYITHQLTNLNLNQNVVYYSCCTMPLTFWQIY